MKNSLFNYMIAFFAVLISVSLGILSGIDEEIQALMVKDDPMRARGFKPRSQPTEYDGQINNLVVVVSRSQEPETAVKTVSCLDKLKQILGN